MDSVHRSERPRRARAGRGATAPRSPLRSDSPAMLGLVAASRNSLCSVRSRRSNSRDESVVDARCARGHEPWPCRPRRARGPAARQAQTVHLDCLCPGLPSRRLAGAPRPARARLGCCIGGSRRTRTDRAARQAVRGGGDLRGDEKRRCGVGAQSALRQLTRRDCLRSEQSERSEFRDATPDRCSEPGHGTVPADCPVPGERPGACKRQGTPCSRSAAQTATA
jgi:hypothetical protein